MKDLRKGRRHGAEVPTHSLNDIMFFLLLFFLIISTMTNPNVIKILTASASPNPVKTPDKKNYELNVTVEKEYFYNGQKVSVEELQKMLVSDLNGNAEMVLAVDLDPDVDIQEMVDVLSLCKESGVKYYLKDPRL